MRIIDADATIKDIDKQVKIARVMFLGDAIPELKQIIDERHKGFVAQLNKMPTIDAVEVVRCKDCRWFGGVGCAIRIWDDSDRPKENDYCSFAERISNEID